MPLSIPPLELKAQFRASEWEIRAAIDHILDSQDFILGRSVEGPEREVAGKLQVRTRHDWLRDVGKRSNHQEAAAGKVGP